MPPLVTIITVTKDCGPTIERTLQSIKNIKSNNIEFIVIDGESVDGTLSVIDRYAHLVDVLLSESDTGIYNAMNKGAKLATGEYILFINGDDFLLAEGFKEALLLLKELKPEVLSCHSEVFSDSGERSSILTSSSRNLLFFNSIPHLATFVSASLQKKYKFRENFKIAADYDLFLRMFMKGHKFTLSKLITAVHYRGGFSSDSFVSQSEVQNIRRQNLGFFLYNFTQGLLILNRFKKMLLNKIGM